MKFLMLTDQERPTSPRTWETDVQPRNVEAAAWIGITSHSNEVDTRAICSFSWITLPEAYNTNGNFKHEATFLWVDSYDVTTKLLLTW